MNYKLITDFKWIHFISTRLSGLDRKSRYSSTRIIPAIGIGFGVMALIVIVSVMNGFQGTSINSLMEISSFHLRLTDKFEKYGKILEKSNSVEEITCITPFLDSQGLLVGNRGKQFGAMIRGIEPDILQKDKGFREQMNLYAGEFSLEDGDSIWLGHSLAKTLGVTLGDKVNIFALSGGAEVDLFDSNRIFTVKALFQCSYAEINSVFAFIPLESAKNMLGNTDDVVYGIKLKDYNKDFAAQTKLKKYFPNSAIESWRDFNKSFFGALRVEKNVLMLLVFLIFLVVAINIYNGMRRMVFERREELCVLQGLGAHKKNIRTIFIIQGLYVGLAGSIPGMIMGLFISVNMSYVFKFLSKASYGMNYFITMLISPEKIFLLSKNYIYNYYADIPAVINFGEIFYITIFGIISAVFSSYLASRKIMQFEIAEVLHDE
ncbi:MAG: FtsX-like permease family protein [Treponemataceae bacterium]